jgi:hypothetical protein
LDYWTQKYGNKLGYKLNCAITNPFLKPEDFENLVGRYRQVWNINFIPWTKTNAEYNAVLQSSNIIFALSGGEGRDLPVYHSVAMGAWPIALKAHAYLDYLNDDNAIFIKPNGKEPAFDGMFFHPNQPYNQGNIFTFSQEDFNKGCEEAERKARIGENLNGLELQKLDYKECVDVLLKDI